MCAAFGAGITVNSCTLTSSTQLVANITIDAKASAGPRNVTVTNAADDNTGGTLANAFSVTEGSPAFTGAISPASAVIPTGSSADFTVTLKSTNGFAGPVALACSGAPTGMDCGFNPPQPNLAANATATATLTVHEATKPASSLVPRAPQNGSWPSSRNLPLALAALAFAAMFLAVILSGVSRQLVFKDRAVAIFDRDTESKNLSFQNSRAVALATFAFALVLAVGLISCSGATTAPHSSASGTGASATGTNGSGASGTAGSGGTSTSSGGTSGSSGSGGSGSGSGSSGSGSSGGSGGSSGGSDNGGGNGSGNGGNGGSGNGGIGGSGGNGGGNGGGQAITTQFTVQAQPGGATVNLGTITVTVP